MTKNSSEKTHQLQRIPNDIRDLIIAVLTEYRLQQLIRLYMRLSDRKQQRMLSYTRIILE